MAKIDKLLLILNLLYHRHHVTLDTIQKECQVSQRSAYRYLRSLSNARFPIYHDPDVGGYRLVDKEGPLAHLTTTEAAVVLFGSLLLESAVAPAHLEAIRTARAKLELKLTSYSQDILQSGKEMLRNPETPQSLKEYIIISLIKLAMVNGNHVKLRYCDESGSGSLELNEPKLTFEQEWKLTGNDGYKYTSGLPLRSISDIELL